MPVRLHQPKWRSELPRPGSRRSTEWLYDLGDSLPSKSSPVPLFIVKVIYEIRQKLNFQNVTTHWIRNMLTFRLSPKQSLYQTICPKWAWKAPKKGQEKPHYNWFPKKIKQKFKNQPTRFQTELTLRFDQIVGLTVTIRLNLAISITLDSIEMQRSL